MRLCSMNMRVPLRYKVGYVQLGRVSLLIL
jgi:hypothetical protein